MEGPWAQKESTDGPKQLLYVFWMKDSQIPMCYQDADMPLAKCSSKQVPNGDISSASLILLLLPCCHFFLFHFACMATNQSWGPFTRPGAALLQGLCTALMLELAKTAKREVCRKCGGEHKPLPQATATPSPSFQVFPLLATFLKQLPFSKALAICCQPFARHYMLPFSLFQGFGNPFHSQSCFQQLFLGSFHVDLTALLHQLLQTIQRCLHRFGMGCVFGATAAF